MARGLFFLLVVWVVVSVGFYTFGHLTDSEKTSVIKSMIFGLVTAAVAAIAVVGIVMLF